MQREQMEQSWEVTYVTRPGSGTHRLWSRHESSAEAHSAARRARADLGASVRVVRVTRCRLAPLRHVARRWSYDSHRVEWRVTTRQCSASVSQCEHEWAWRLCGTTDEHTIFDLRGVVRSCSGHAAFVAVAEAARLMGYRLPKAPETP